MRGLVSVGRWLFVSPTCQSLRTVECGCRLTSLSMDYSSSSQSCFWATKRDRMIGMNPTLSWEETNPKARKAIAFLTTGSILSGSVVATETRMMRLRRSFTRCRIPYLKGTDGIQLLSLLCQSVRLSVMDSRLYVMNRYRHTVEIFTAYVFLLPL